MESAIPSIRPAEAPLALSAIRLSSIADRDRIREFLLGLSPDTLYQRFLTGLGTPSSTLVAHLATGGAGAALLAEIDGLVVGHGLWAPVVPHPDGARSTAEIAVVVADRHQRRGVGTALADALLADLARHGFDRASVVTTVDNRAVLRMIARQDPSARPARDGITVTYDLAVPAVVGSALRSA